MEIQINPKYNQNLSYISLADLDNLPGPDVFALEIIENLVEGLESFREAVRSLNSKK